MEFENPDQTLQRMLKEFGDHFMLRWDAGRCPPLMFQQSGYDAVLSIRLVQPLMGHFIITMNSLDQSITVNLKWRSEYIHRNWVSIDEYFSPSNTHLEKIQKIYREINEWSHVQSNGRTQIDNHDESPRRILS